MASERPRFDHGPGKETLKSGAEKSMPRNRMARVHNQITAPRGVARPPADIRAESNPAGPETARAARLTRDTDRQGTVTGAGDPTRSTGVNRRARPDHLIREGKA